MAAMYWSMVTGLPRPPDCTPKKRIGEIYRLVGRNDVGMNIDEV
jgi:hypothetical protein